MIFWFFTFLCKLELRIYVHSYSICKFCLSYLQMNVLLTYASYDNFKFEKYEFKVGHDKWYYFEMKNAYFNFYLLRSRSLLKDWFPLTVLPVIEKKKLNNYLYNLYSTYSWVPNRRVYSFICHPRNMKKETDTKTDKSI